jgi:soluble lytic murein transglycosylase-like protein
MRRFGMLLLKIACKQALACVLLLAFINWMSSAGSWRNPLGLLSGGYMKEKMTALGLAGRYVAGNFWAVPDREEVYRLIDRAGSRHQVERGLLYALVEVESSWRFYAVSPRGACGYMQLLLPTAAALGVPRGSVFDAEQNIDAGARYLKMLITRFDGDLRLALAAYNWGPTYINRAGRELTPAMENYIGKILKARSGYAGQL